uniref:Uncharacterized protein n=1 Tax=Vitis vinifera TaxID=29760 RepID=F6H3J4_VITVI
MVRVRKTRVNPDPKGKEELFFLFLGMPITGDEKPFYRLFK